VHQNTGKLKKTARSDRVTAWLLGYFNEIGDRMPMGNGDIHMPMYLDKAEIFRTMKADLDDIKFSKSAFYKLLSEEFGYVKFPKRTRLGRCDECSSLVKDKPKTLGSRDREQWITRKRNHEYIYK
jgi:hypothetical protein